MMDRLRGRWRYAVAIVAAAILVWYVTPAALVSTLRDTRPLWLALYLGALLFVPVLYSMQLAGVLRLGGHKVPGGQLLAAGLQAWGVGSITPVRAGDLSLAYFLRGHVPPGDALAAVAMDKLISLATLAAVTLVAASLISIPYKALAVLAAAAVLLIAVMTLIVVCMPGADTLLRSIACRLPGGQGESTWLRMRSLVGSSRVLTWCLAMTASRWLYICFTNVLVFRSVTEHPDFGHIVAATAAGRIISLIPVSIGGIGIKEPAQIVIYGAAGTPAEAVIAVSALGFTCGLAVAAMTPPLASAVLRAATAREAA